MGAAAARSYPLRNQNPTLLTMKTSQHVGRILRHGERADEVTAEAIDLRAKELALIDGRSPSAITELDRERALAELRGDHLPETTLEDSVGTESLSRDPSDPRADDGDQAPMINPPEDQEIAERLVLEGVEEAQHEQMLEDRRSRRDV